MADSKDPFDGDYIVFRAMLVDKKRKNVDDGDRANSPVRVKMTLDMQHMEIEE